MSEGGPRADPLRRWQRRVFVTCWITYASLYLGRVNLAVALPALQDAFGWAKSQTALIGMAFFWIYALGQLVNGSLGDRWNPRRFVAWGLIASAIANLAFGFSRQLVPMALLWGFNGYVQSTGWGPIVRVLSQWFDPRQRGRITALFGPCYAVGHVASWLLAGWLAARFGWRAAFWVPAALLAAAAWHWWARVRTTPREAQLPVLSADTASPPGNLGNALRDAFAYILRRRGLQLGAMACLLLGVVKESFALWIPTYLTETQRFNIAQAAGYAIWLPLAGAGGMFLFGWVSHHFFHAEETPVVAGLMFLLLLIVAAYRPLVAALGAVGIVLSLGVMGVVTYGANGLLLTALPLRHSGHVSSVAGALDFASYVGAGLGGLCTGAVADRWGWDGAFGFWIGAAALGAALMMWLWWQSRAEPASSGSRSS